MCCILFCLTWYYLKRTVLYMNRRVSYCTPKCHLPPPPRHAINMGNTTGPPAFILLPLATWRSPRACLYRYPATQFPTLQYAIIVWDWCTRGWPYHPPLHKVVAKTVQPCSTPFLGVPNCEVVDTLRRLLYCLMSPQQSNQGFFSPTLLKPGVLTTWLSGKRISPY